MSKQPKALELADLLDGGENFYAESSMWFDVKLANAAGDAADELRRLHLVNAELLAALVALLRRDELNTCQHQETHRGGVLWTICDDCDLKWADDEGGKPKWRDPKEWRAARAAIAAATPPEAGGQA